MEIKLEVLRDFQDSQAGLLRKKGDVFTVTTKKRADEILNHPQKLATIIEIKKEEVTEKKAPRAKRTRKK